MDRSYGNWLNVLETGLMEVGATTYDGEHAEKLFNEGYEPAEAIGELFEPEDR